MAYQIRRQDPEIEELQLVNRDGSVAETLEVALNGADLAERVSKEYVNLLNAQSYANDPKTGKDPESMAEAVEKLGNCVIDLYNAALGEENTRKILDFYNGRTLEMIQEVNPFVIDVVIPKARKIAQQNRKAARASYRKGIFQR